MGSWARRMGHCALSALALWLLVGGSAAGQDPPISFEHLTTADGLSSNSIYCITQDRLGFLWIGTAEGLNRYDGHTVRVYRHDPDDPTSLSEDHVHSILEDTAGNLWVATYGGGLERFDRARESFVHYRLEAGDPQSLSNNKVSALHQDRAGVLWVGTAGGGLQQYDPVADAFVHYRHDPADPGSLADDTVNVIYEDRSATLWIGTGTGLDRFDRETGQFVHRRRDPQDPMSLSGSQVFAIWEDTRGTLWIGSSGGLDRYERESGSFGSLQRRSADVSSPGRDAVSALIEDGAGILWIAYFGGGLQHYDPIRQQFAQYRNNPDDPESLSDNYVATLFEDAEGTIWIGTTQGLDKYARYQERFRRRIEIPYVEAILEAADGTVWVGALDGLHHLDRDLQPFALYQHDPDDEGSLGQGLVQVIFVDGQGALWAGVAGGGLNRIDPASGRVTRYRHDPNDRTSLISDRVSAIAEDRDGNLWIATDGGLNLFDRRQKTFRPVSTDPEQPGAAGVESIGPLLVDRQDRLWAGTWGDGLKRLDPVPGETGPLSDGMWTAYRHNTADAASLASNFLTALLQDSTGRLWVGTDEGLHLYDPAADRFRLFGEAEGLGGESVATLMEDDAGDLWIGTASGLWRLDPATGQITRYGIGPAATADYYAAGCRRTGGEILFGGADGIVAFRPEEIVANPYAPPVVLISLRANGQPIALGPARQGGEAVVLSWLQDDVEFEFSALSFSQPERNQHAYLLEGYDSGWHYSGTGRIGRYTRLPGGTYSLRLKGSNGDGVWNEGTAVTLTVMPPLWGTWWFRGTAGLAVVAAVAGAYWLRVRSVEGRSRQLERQVASRTKELAALNSVATVVSSSLELSQVLGGALDKTLELMGLEAGGIYLMQPAPSAAVQPTLKLAAHRGLSPQVVQGIDNLVVGEGFSGRVVEAGEPLVVSDLAADPRLTRSVVRESGFRSLAIAPLLSRGKTLGTLFAITRNAVEFSTPDTVLLGSIGGQIGVAIENADLYKEQQRRAEQFRVIAEMGSQITSILEIDQVLTRLVQLIWRTFGYDHVGIALVEGGYAEYKVGAGKLWDDPGFGFRPNRLKVGSEGVTGWVAGSGEPLLIPDVRREPRYIWMEGSDTRSELTVPIQLKGVVIGVLDVQSDRLSAFDQTDLSVMQALADQAAVAIENARLFDAEQRRVEQFRVINEVGTRTTSMLTLDDLLNQIATLIQYTLGYYHVGIGLVEGDEVVSKAEAGALADIYRGVRLKVGEQGMWGRVARTGEAMLSGDVHHEPRYSFVPGEEKVRSHICVPLKTKDTVIGVLSAGSNQHDAFDHSDLEVLQSLASQAAVAIENTRLYHQAQQLAVMEERQRLARELHDAVTQTLFSASLIAEALPDLWEADQDEGRQLLQELRQLSRGALAEMRTLLLELRPAALVDANLADLLRQLGEAVAGRTGIPVRVSVEVGCAFPPDVHVAFYRIAQEALNNVVKHASPSQVAVRLSCIPEAPAPDGPESGRARAGEASAMDEVEQDGRAIQLEITDDGRGFDLDSVAPDRLGLGIIRERAQSIGASLQITSQPGRGTQIIVIWHE